MYFPRFRPPAPCLFVDEEALLGIDTSGTGIGEAAGDEGADAVARIRRWEMIDSNSSSKGNENSSRKKGCAAKFSLGDGEPIDIGAELLDLER